MDNPDIYDFITNKADEGRAGMHLKLYPKQEQKLIKDGFSVQRLAKTQKNSHRHDCSVDWSMAAPGTIAYKMLLMATKKNPKLLKRRGEDGSNELPVSPPYSYSFIPELEGK